MNLVECGKYLERKVKELDKELVLIAIDGRSGGGKSTLSYFLNEMNKWQVVHMDDFFLPRDRRTEERLSKPGENVDHERFLEEVLKPLSEGRTAAYRKFDCSKDSLAPEVYTVEPKGVIIIEGAYALHPDLRPYYDRTLFVTADPDKQLERLERREGREALGKFRSKWIPMEEAYIAAFDLENNVDDVLNFI